MQNRVIIVAALAGAAFFGAVVSGLVSAQQSTPKASGPMDRAAIEQVVRDVIRDDPAIIVEALNLYSENHLKNTVRSYLPTLLSEDSGYIAGKNAKTADVAVVEFFDYHCGFCKRSAGFVRELVEKEPGVKIAFRELPILREESEVASRYALAARAQGKYLDFHFAMLAHNGVLTEAKIQEIAKGVGLDVEKLKADSKDPAFAQIISDDQQAARQMGIDGTPTFIVASLDNDFISVVPGFRPDDLKAAIADARKSGKTK